MLARARAALGPLGVTGPSRLLARSYTAPVSSDPLPRIRAKDPSPPSSDGTDAPRRRGRPPGSRSRPRPDREHDTPDRDLDFDFSRPSSSSSSSAPRPRNPKGSDRSDMSGRTRPPRSSSSFTPRPPRIPPGPADPPSAVRPGRLAHLNAPWAAPVAVSAAAAAAMLADEVGDIEIEEGGRGTRERVPTLPSEPSGPSASARPASREIAAEDGSRRRNDEHNGGRDGRTRTPREETRWADTDAGYEGRMRGAQRKEAWGEGGTWRDWDTSRLPPLREEDIKFHLLPADFDNTIQAVNSPSRERISVRYPLFMGVSIPATHVTGGGALAPPPFPPPLLHSGVYPDGLPPSSKERAHLARRSADARAGTGFAFPSEMAPAARVFVLVPKSRVSRLSVERRRCRNRFFAAWRHVTNRTEGAPPLSHKRVYSFVLNAGIFDAPFAEVCEMVERAIRELDRKVQPTPRGQARWTGRR